MKAERRTRMWISGLIVLLAFAGCTDNAEIDNNDDMKYDENGKEYFCFHDSFTEKSEQQQDWIVDKATFGHSNLFKSIPENASWQKTRINGEDLDNRLNITIGHQGGTISLETREDAVSVNELLANICRMDTGDWYFYPYTVLDSRYTAYTVNPPVDGEVGKLSLDGILRSPYCEATGGQGRLSITVKPNITGKRRTFRVKYHIDESSDRQHFGIDGIAHYSRLEIWITQD